MKNWQFSIQITEQLNKRTVANYCKDQVTAKLQNLKAQFRQRKAAVEAGHGEMRDWKWYDRMAEIMLDGKDDSGYGDFPGADSRVKTPPSNPSKCKEFKIFMIILKFFNYVKFSKKMIR